MKLLYPQYAAPFAAFLQATAGQKISIIGHQRPDGDCVGSQVALCRVLRARGADAICLNSDPVPRRIKFLVGDELAAVQAGKFLRRKLREIRAVVAKNVILRQVPLLTFVHDDHAPRTLRIEQLLADIDEKESKL